VKAVEEEEHIRLCLCLIFWALGCHHHPSPAPAADFDAPAMFDVRRPKGGAGIPRPAGSPSPPPGSRFFGIGGCVGLLGEREQVTTPTRHQHTEYFRWAERVAKVESAANDHESFYHWCQDRKLERG
jgi:hypothetical protein